VEAARVKQQEAASAMLQATTTPAHHIVGDHDDDDDEQMPNGHSEDLDSDMVGEDPVEGMRTQAEQNERLQSQLQKLKTDLAEMRDETRETTMDKLHKENVRQGRDKYKTLREIRKGNTKRRVDQFENM